MSNVVVDEKAYERTLKDKMFVLLRKLVMDHNYILSLILLLIIGRIASDQFLSVASLVNLLKSSVFIGIIALGMTPGDYLG